MEKNPRAIRVANIRKREDGCWCRCSRCGWRAHQPRSDRYKNHR